MIYAHYFISFTHAISSMPLCILMHPFPSMPTTHSFFVFLSHPNSFFPFMSPLKRKNSSKNGGFKGLHFSNVFAVREQRTNRSENGEFHQNRYPCEGDFLLYIVGNYLFSQLEFQCRTEKTKIRHLYVHVRGEKKFGKKHKKRM